MSDLCVRFSDGSIHGGFSVIGVFLSWTRSPNKTIKTYKAIKRPFSGEPDPEVGEPSHGGVDDCASMITSGNQDLKVKGLQEEAKVTMVSGPPSCGDSLFRVLISLSLRNSNSNSN